MAQLLMTPDGRYVLPDGTPVAPTEEQAAMAIPHPGFAGPLLDEAMAGDLALDDAGTGVLDPTAVVPAGQMSFRDRQRELSAKAKAKREAAPPPVRRVNPMEGQPLTASDKARNLIGQGGMPPAAFASLGPAQQAAINKRRAVQGLPAHESPTQAAEPIVPVKPAGPIVPIGPQPTGGSGAGFRVSAPTGDLSLIREKMEKERTRGAGEYEKMAGQEEVITAAKGIVAGDREAMEKQKADEEYAFRNAADTAEEKRIADRALKNVEFNKRMAGEMSKLNALRQDAANTTIDPTRFWTNRSTGDKVIASISMLLGAVGSAYGSNPAGGNPAMAVLRRAIQDDIDAQKANLGQKNQNLRSQESFMAQVRSQYSTEAEQNEAMRVAGLEHAKSRLATLAAGMGGKDASIRAREAMLQLEDESLQSRINLMQMREAGTIKNLAEQGDLAAHRASLSFQASVATAQGQPATPYDYSIHGLRLKNPNAPPPPLEMLKKAEEEKSSAQDVIVQFDKLIALRKRAGTMEVWNREMVDEAKVLAGAAQLAFARMNTMGAYDKGSAEKLNSMLEDPTAASLANAAGIKALRESVRNKLENSVSNKGFLLIPDRPEPK